MSLTDPATALYRCIREVAEYTAEEGWDQPAQVFALVPTAELAIAEPSLQDELDDASELSAVAQDPLPPEVGDDPLALEKFLATTSWPAAVAGCLLVQQVVLLPPDAEDALDEAIAPVLADRAAADRAARDTAATHPGRRDARLFTGVLRDSYGSGEGAALSLLQLRPADDEADDNEADPFDVELRSYPPLASGLAEALRDTLDSDPYGE